MCSPGYSTYQIASTAATQCQGMPLKEMLFHINKHGLIYISELELFTSYVLDYFLDKEISIDV